MIPQNTKEINVQTRQSSASETLNEKGQSRRRFTRVGVVTSGVLLTLHSQPGMAAEVCATASGSLSGGIASFQASKVTCAGRSPGYWARHSWPAGCDKETLFTRVFPCDSSSFRDYGRATLGDILKPKKFDKHGIGRHLVACWLNVKAGLSSFQTEQQLRTIWYEYSRTGYYTPTAGVRWDGNRIAQYLQSTFD